MKKQKRCKGKNLEKFKEMNVNAAGIDIGSEEHFVAVPEGRDDVKVRSFKSFTSDLYELANWLKKCKIDTVAMESTGVYWISLLQILEEKGFEVLLVNAKHVKNVPGRKSDVKDCQWIQQLHTYGLLSGSFQPEDKIRKLRTYLRQRDNLVKYASSHVQHIQKSLTLMNITLHNVISDITGVSGMRIVRSIIRGERNPEELVKFCDGRLKTSTQVILKSLEGNYTDENIFTLKQAIDLYDYYQRMIKECDDEIKKLLNSFDGKDGKVEQGEEKSNAKRKKIEDPDLHAEMIRITGVDLIRIDGLNTNNVVTLISETGLDMSKWKTEKHFTSWLGLAPDNKISGGKVLSSGTKKVKSRASNAFRMAAYTLSNSNSYLGAIYRKLKYRLGPAKANVAIARKIAVLYYLTLKHGIKYVDYGCDYFEKRHMERNIKYLKKRAKEFGLVLIPQSA